MLRSAPNAVGFSPPSLPSPSPSPSTTTTTSTSTSTSTSTTLRFRVLGPLRGWVGGREVALGPLKQRLVLAMLLCRSGSAVSVEALTEAVWGQQPPRTARKNLQAYVLGIRRILQEAGAGERLLLRSGGYQLLVSEDELDLLRLSALARAGREAADRGAVERAARILGRARRLWDGPPLGELAASDSVRAEAERLDVRYTALCEDWADVALEAGLADEVAEAAGELLGRHPLRERLQVARMTALYRSGRRAEALAEYDEARKLLARELGLSPSPVAESVYRAILADEGGDTRVRVRRLASAVDLPPQNAGFVGRTAALAELTEVAAVDGGTCLLVGEAGVGKTALALRAAHGLDRAFPDGRIFVRLREPDGSPRPLMPVVAELLSYTGRPEPASVNPEREAARWRLWAATRRILLVLDDASDEETVRTLLPGGRSSAIVTACSQLAGLTPTCRMQLAPLSADKALALLAGVAGSSRVRSDPAAAERLVVLCGMLPLTIRAAALKLAVLPHLELVEYAARLSSPETALDHLEVGDVRVRARAAREWCCLRPSHRAIVRDLAETVPPTVPPTRFTLRDVTAVAGVAPDRACVELESMLEEGALISPDGATYSLPYITYLYARELAARSKAAPVPAWSARTVHAGGPLVRRP
ncbi:winged helix-turn-helix domain-containing protein [Actinospica sp. MGRD01-02]|uniref:Winged helix-turn-helix domain-containing protein n=1 Tax=Actinospica acidithermotolerans TaxID=2828514 RepID=A0A941IH79_9ACTN|nr:BTAD domain-containing putative transcriptional regulator [Actinospica acidithermotolerans]MBR7826919.1 winged helix-turn-helix domain-containing protein [Actinospica acidithermotolerans]